LKAGGWRPSFSNCRLSTVDCRLSSGWRLQVSNCRLSTVDYPAAGGPPSPTVDCRLSTVDYPAAGGWRLAPDGSPSSTVDCRLSTLDADDSGRLELTDAVRILNYLFQQGAAPPAPFPFCGEDPTEDTVLCEDYGVFFVIDHSGSMLDAGELAVAKREAEGVIQAFPDGIEFGVIFSATFQTRFPVSGNPARTDAETRAAAVEFVRAVGGGSGSCHQPSLLSAIELARRTSGRRDVILFMTDGSMTCGQDEKQYLRETLEAVTAANQNTVNLYSLQIGPASALQENFLRDLAAMNGGEYLEVPLR
jgi:hypothetical protein